MLGTLTPAQIDEVLTNTFVGRIGVSNRGKVYVVPITYAYDGDAVYGHSVEGTKLKYLRKRPYDVCFEVDQIDNLANWRSVIAYGDFEELHGDAAERAWKLLVDRFRPVLTSRTTGIAHGGGVEADVAVVYRIVLKRKTGRFEQT